MGLPDETVQALLDLVENHFQHSYFQAFLSTYRHHLPADENERRSAFHDTVFLYLSLTFDMYHEVSEEDALCFLHDEVGHYADAEPGTAQHNRYLALCGAHYFTRICHLCADGPPDVQYALRAAADRQMDDLIPMYCCSVNNRSPLAALVVEALWAPDHRYIHLFSSNCVDLFHAGVIFYVKKTLAKRDSWANLNPLAVWEDIVYFDLRYLFVRMTLTEQEAAAVPDFTQSCAEGGAWSVAVLAAAVLGQWPVMQAVIARMPELTRTEYCHQVLDLLLIKKSSPKVLLDAMIELLSDGSSSLLEFDPWLMSKGLLRRLASLSKRTRRHKWAMFLYIHLQDWQAAEAVIQRCRDQDAFDDIFLFAALSGHWQVVPSLIPRSSKSATLFLPAFKAAIDDCRVDIVELLLPAVDLSQVDIDAILTRRRLRGDDFPEGEALDDLTTPQIKENFVKIVRLLVQRGASTHCRQGKAALTHALVWRLPSVAHMLITSGAVTRADYSHSLEQGAVKTVLAANPHLKKCLEASAQQAFPQGTRSLLDMCRLAVSHQVGPQPGRQDRVQALHIPTDLKKFVAFKDVC